MPWSKGSHHSEETKQRISEAKMGCKVSGETRVRMSEAQKGHLVSEEARLKIGKASKGRKHSIETRKRLREVCAGEKNPNWLGGISFKPYSPEFTENLKDMVRERDGYICRLCGKHQYQNGRKLDVHHIDYDKKNNVIGNLVALCLTCHPITNRDRECWAGCFKELD